MTTLQALLFSKPYDQSAAANKLAGSVESPQMSQAIIRKAAEHLNFELGAVLIEAWRTRSALLTAARETQGDPSLVREVTLKTYAVPWDFRMELEVNVSGKHVLTIPVSVLLEIEVTALKAIVQKGLLTRIDGGQYLAKATLSARDIPLLTRERKFDLRYEVQLGSGLSLLKT